MAREKQEQEEKLGAAELRETDTDRGRALSSSVSTLPQSSCSFATCGINIIQF